MGGDWSFSEDGGGVWRNGRCLEVLGEVRRLWEEMEGPGASGKSAEVEGGWEGPGSF